jgi:hypothetical protein
MKKYIITEELVQKIGVLLLSLPMGQVEPLVQSLRTELKEYVEENPNVDREE